MPCYAGCAKRRKPSTNIMIGSRKLKDVIEVSSCLSGQCKPPWDGLGGTSIVKGHQQAKSASLMASTSSAYDAGLGPWRGTGGLALTKHASEPAAAVSNACLQQVLDFICMHTGVLTKSRR